MYVDGFGDPTNGHGGLNYIKYPLKMSWMDALYNKITQKDQINNLGSKSDLRGLNMDWVH